MREYSVSVKENIITFVRDHGECYGGERTTKIDTQGKTGKELYKRIKECVGADFAKAAKQQGFC